MHQSSLLEGIVKRIDHHDIRSFVELCKEYDQNHVSKWYNRSPLSENALRRGALAYYSQSAAIFLYMQEYQAHGFVIANRFESVGAIEHIYSSMKGGGSVLLKAAEDELRRKGASKIDLLVHARNNGHASRFFKKHGYDDWGYSKEHVHFSKMI